MSTKQPSIYEDTPTRNYDFDRLRERIQGYVAYTLADFGGGAERWRTAAPGDLAEAITTMIVAGIAPDLHEETRRIFEALLAEQAETPAEVAR